MALNSPIMLATSACCTCPSPLLAATPLTTVLRALAMTTDTSSNVDPGLARSKALSELMTSPRVETQRGAREEGEEPSNTDSRVEPTREEIS